jgi:hypothetical protein
VAEDFGGEDEPAQRLAGAGVVAHFAPNVLLRSQYAGALEERQDLYLYQ